MRGRQKPVFTFLRVRAKSLNWPPCLRGCDKCGKPFELGSIVLRIGFRQVRRGKRHAGNRVSFWRHVPCYVDARGNPVFRDPNRLRVAKPRLAERQRDPRGPSPNPKGLPHYKADRPLLDQLAAMLIGSY